MRRLPAVLAAFVALVLVAVGTAAVAAAPASVSYRPPVDAPIVDPFRPPPKAWAAGNRGVEYATAPGTRVAAAAAGEVVFSGPVAGALHVVVLHADGIRTSYSFLESVAVHRGDRVGQGRPVGTTGARLHFGARAGDAYVDPTLLFGGGGPPEVHLVPDELRRPGTEAQERTGLVVALGRRIADAGGATVDWARQRASDRLEELRGAIHYAREGQPLTHALRLADILQDWWRQRDRCTPPDVDPPRRQDRHLAVTVGGLGSSGDEAGIDDVDTAALGYAAGDVSRFSYRGGTVDDNGYAAPDTTVDIRHSARRLRELLERLALANPGVPIDVIAHSQGGLVARSALTDEFDGLDPRLPPMGALVTLATPHQGADLATALTMVGFTKPGTSAQKAVGTAFPEIPDPRGESLRQMSETSSFIRELNERPLPGGIRATSIAARGDIVVPAGRSQLAGASNVIVSVPGLATDHSHLPGSEAARREIALGLAGMPPTCQSLSDSVVDFAVSDRISAVEDSVGSALWFGGRRASSSPRPKGKP
ncbi:MAG: peptidoglycan DD-metalloendopeptidase family protein [Actinomycetota bacterium]|nr:peptidoglycan DD-metalloendopeptidase family protein [Actinomycetota bacterium]